MGKEIRKYFEANYMKIQHIRILGDAFTQYAGGNL